MHNHSHHHAHDSESGSKRIGWAFALNVSFTIIEFIGGVLTNSTAIMADAVHDLGDSLSIGLAWILAKLSNKDPDEQYSYGYRRFSLLGAMINGLVLILGSAWVLTEAIPRIANPEMPVAEGMLGLAILGVAVNGFAAYKLSAGKTLNERVLNWHLMEDVLGWVAVLIVSIILMFYPLPILDPILSIGFTLFILFNVIKNITLTVKLFLQASPDEHLYQNIKNALLNLDNIEDIHHFHLWSLDGEQHVLSAHLVLRHSINMPEQQSLKQNISIALKDFEIHHTTIELELNGEICRDKG